jgi:uncharacterized protein
MAFLPPPPAAAWQHQHARVGFEVVYFHRAGDGYRIEGCTTAMEDGRPWAVDYEIWLDGNWATRVARIGGRSASGPSRTTLRADGQGHWQVDGQDAPHLAGSLDVDLESSAMTNALPVHRLGLAVGERAAATAAFVRAPGLQTELLEQTYLRAEDDGTRQRYDYAAPAFAFAARLVYDASGLVLHYPGIAVRAA